MAGRYARQPEPGYVAPSRVDGLRVTYVAEGASQESVIDLSTWDAPEQLKRDLALGIAHVVGPTGAWRSVETVRGSLGHVRKFVEFIGSLEGVHSAKDLTPGVWNEWRLHVQSSGLYTEQMQFFALIKPAVVVRDAPQVPDETKEQTRRRIGSPPPSEGTRPYPLEHFDEIQIAALQVLASAHARITKQYGTALRFERRTLHDPHTMTVGKALSETLTSGVPATVESCSHIDAVTSTSDGRGGERLRPSHARARHHLFLTSDEALAAAVVIACVEGLNKNVIAQRKVPSNSASLGDAQPVYTVTDDKPRRGPKSRYSIRTLSMEKAQAMQLVIEATEPAREHLRRRNQPTDRLLVHWREGDSPSLGFRRSEPSWWPPGIDSLNWMRIRETFVVHVSHEPNSHSRRVFENDYRNADPVIRAKALRDAAAGLARLAHDAEEKFQGTLVPESDPKNDTVLGGCADYEHEPSTGVKCRRSFLTCLECRNMRVSTRHLPFQLAVLDVLDQLGSAAFEAWAARFAGPYGHLKGFLHNRNYFSEAAIEDARTRITDEHRVRAADLIHGKYRTR